MRFIHTADWQLGLKLRFLNPERAAQLRLLRFQVVREIAAVAKSCEVDFVLVAGDVLDDNGLGRDSLQQTTDALEEFSGIPVFLLPGNHDAATPDSALRRLDLPNDVQLLASREPVPVRDGFLYPCPLMRRHEMDDPTSWLPERQPGEGIRVAMAHGGVIDFTQSEGFETPNLIDANRVIKKGFDYLALGDWHGTFSYGPRVWYPGAPEATRFKENKPGSVLLVEIASTGAVPVVTPISVTKTRWLKKDVEFIEATQVEELAGWLAKLDEKSHTLLELDLSGVLPLGARDRLDVLLDDYAKRLVHLRADLSLLQTEPTEEDLAAMSTEGFQADALNALRSASDDTSVAAIRLLYRLQQEASRATA